MASSLNHLAEVHLAAKAYPEARVLLTRALAIRERVFGPDHPDVAEVLGNLGAPYLGEGRPQNALPLLERAVAIAAAHEGVQEGEFAARFALAGRSSPAAATGRGRSPRRGRPATASSASARTGPPRSSAGWSSTRPDAINQGNPGAASRRFAAIGDIHAEVVRLALAVLADSDSTPSSPLATSSSAPTTCAHLLTVRGNHDR